ncbi:glycosyl transferases group 1-domain-containing protein [Cladochytrium replicatum]|nr:glycosyl transferases group 1-domain-containing protein [Cladochytrium replicatum]
MWLLAVLLLVVALGISLLFIRKSPKDGATHVTVLVLGDIARSPRMMYHAKSLSKLGFSVDLIGYVPDENEVPSSLLNVEEGSGKITIHAISVPNKIPAGGSPLWYLLRAVLRVVQQLVSLFVLVGITVPKADYFLIQNPPSIPTLFVAQTVCFVRGSKLVIDWHNFGYSLMALNLGKRSKIVMFAERFEKFWGQHAFVHLCVTNAMSKFLKETWMVKGTVIVVHDRPPPHFRPLSELEIHELYLRVGESLGFTKGNNNSTFLVRRDETGTYVRRTDRPVLVVSSTSWTEDEDFSILLKAADIYDSSPLALPHVLFVITGKGPKKGFYESQIAEKSYKKVTIKTAWLASEDYWKLLGSADLGISLHTSSSGIDLPMKVVDMFGCGLTVCALKFSCIDELVQHQKNGLIFENADELSRQLMDLFSEFPFRSTSELARLKQGASTFREQTWDSNWNELVAPYFSRASLSLKRDKKLQ